MKRISWEQINFDRKVIKLERSQTKNEEPRSLPMFGDIVEALVTAKRKRNEFYADFRWVFSRAGER